MFWKTAGLVCLGVATIAVPGWAQTPPVPPVPPHTPGARSVITRSLSKRGYLGVGVVELTAERAKALKLADDSGVEVKRVEENSPAAKAGVKENDIILEVNGQKVDDIDEFIRTVGETSPGSKVNLTIWRNGSKQNIAATVESRPVHAFAFGDGDFPPMPPLPPMEPFSIITGQSPRVGFEGEALTAQLAQYFGVTEGVLVRTVFEKTPAEKAGLKAGDVIVKVSNTPVTSPREISGLVRASHKTVTFTVIRNHKEITLNMEIAEDRIAAHSSEVL